MTIKMTLFPSNRSAREPVPHCTWTIITVPFIPRMEPLTVSFSFGQGKGEAGRGGGAGKGTKN